MESDRRERIIISSRAITKDSKRVIFKLHRIISAPSLKERNVLLSQAEKNLEKIRENIFSLFEKELSYDYPHNFYYFSRQYTCGLQEYVEAESFLYYLKHDGLLTLERVEEMVNSVRDEREKMIGQTLPSFKFPIGDYVLGLSDLTGEMMRLAINLVGQNDYEHPLRILDFMHALYALFLRINDGTFPEMLKKVEVMHQSVMKVEKICYEMKLKNHYTHSK